MVKPDAKHDYYADLELPITADADDVKKQFRQLGEQRRNNCIENADQSQLSSIILIEILAERSRWLRNFRQFKQHMRS
jgi:hypothetical protein